KEQKNTSNPIQIAGFDMQPHTNNLLYDYFLKFDATFAENVQEAETNLKELENSIFSIGFSEKEKDEREVLIAEYEKLSNEWTSLHTTATKGWSEDVNKLVVEYFNLRITSLMDYFTEENFSENSGFNSYAANKRDEMMSNNLVWLLEEVYPDEKFIVWAHNAHIMKSESTVDKQSYKRVNMIEQLPDRIKEQAYGIGLYMYSGYSMSDDRSVIMPVYSNHKGNSVEHLLHEPNYPVAFLNIDIADDENNTYWWNSEAIGKSSGEYEETFVPSEQYDGLILIEEVNSSNYVKDN
uniref:erythromycin esterase family protein n=1 Tax=Longirhabdus pacifica TaxID=2305227 RepID=UPI0013E8A817